MFTLEQIFSFTQVYETGSYSQAAKLLGKKRSTVREQVLSLEDSTGLKLFDLEGKHLTPTTQAEAIYIRSKHLDKHAKDLTETITSLYSNSMTELVICHDPLVPIELLVGINRALKQSFPELTVRMHARLTKPAFEEIKQGLAHVALMASENLIATSSELDLVNLGTLKFEAYVASHHPICRSQKISVNELRLVKQIMTESALSGGLGNYPLSVNQQIVSNVDLLLEFLLEEGWSVLPTTIARPLVRQNKLYRVQLDEFLQSQPHNICAFLPIGYQSNSKLMGIVDIIRSESKRLLT